MRRPPIPIVRCVSMMIAARCRRCVPTSAVLVWRLGFEPSAPSCVGIEKPLIARRRRAAGQRRTGGLRDQVRRVRPAACTSLSLERTQHQQLVRQRCGGVVDVGARLLLAGCYRSPGPDRRALPLVLDGGRQIDDGPSAGSIYD